MLASRNGHIEVAKLLIEHGAKVNMQGSDLNLSALMLASRFGHYEVTKLLLDNGAQPDMKNNDDKTSLMLASYHGHYKVTELLLKNGARVELKDKTGSSALLFASQEGFYHIVKLLLKYDTQIDVQNKYGVSALYAGSNYGHYEVVELLLNSGAQICLENNNGLTPLHAAASNGHNRVVKLLLTGDIPVDMQNYSVIPPLVFAIIGSHYDTAELLIKNGANVNIGDTTALIFTCMLSFSTIPGIAVSTEIQRKIVKLLLKHGAEPNLQNYMGYSALMLTADCETAKLLLDHGAQPNLVDGEGCSALMTTVNYDMARLLLDYGAQPNLLNKSGHSLLGHFIFYQQKRIVELLLARGAQTNMLTHNIFSPLTLAAFVGGYEIVKLFQKITQVDKTDLWKALCVAIDKCLTDNTYDKEVAKILFEMCLQVIRRNQVLVADSAFPGIVFYGSPIQESVTSEGATILSEDTGISLSIPEHSLSPGEEVDLLIHPCLSGPFELPPGYESASPAYLIQPSRRANLQRDVTLDIHHYANLVNEEDCEEMAFLSASTTPQIRQSGPVYVFKEIKQTKGIFTPNSQVGQIRGSHFCFGTIGRRRRRVHPSFNEVNYSVRLYRSDLSQSTGVTAVFCMCLYHPLYIKHCDERIIQKYNCEEMASSVFLARMKTDEVTLSASHSQGWTVIFDREPTKIRKRDVDLPKFFNGMNISELTDYPPKFSIFAHRQQTCSDADSSRPQLQVQGLDVEDCSFEILTPPCSTRSSTSPSPAPPPTSPAPPPTAPATLPAPPPLTQHVLQQRSQLTRSQKDTYSLPNLFELLTELETINRELSFLALVLGVEMGDIETDYPHSVEKRREQMLLKWLKTGGDSVSWETLCDALRNKLVGRPDVADTIQKKHCH